MKRIRQIAPWILMVAYLPLLLSLSFHKHEVHEDQFEKCPECANHLTHRSHLVESGMSPHDCIYCQLTASVYLGSAFNTLNCKLPITDRVIITNLSPVTRLQYGVVGTRAPPIL